MKDDHAHDDPERLRIRKQAKPMRFDPPQHDAEPKESSSPARRRKPPLFPIEEEPPRRSTQAAQRRPPLFPTDADPAKESRPRRSSSSKPSRPIQSAAQAYTPAFKQPGTATPRRKQPLFPMDWEEDANPRPARRTTTRTTTRTRTTPATPVYNDDDDDREYDDWEDNPEEETDLDWEARHWDTRATAHPYAAPYPVPTWDVMLLRPSGCLTTRVLVLAGVALLSLLVIVTMWPGTFGHRLSGWQGSINQFTTSLGLPRPFEQPEPHPPGDYALRAPQSLTAEQIDAILASYNSPATGTGRVWVDAGHKYDIDAAFALAFFIHESSAGTNPGWAGLKDDGHTTHNVGNIICAGYPRCYGRFRDYSSWEEGIEDWYRLIDIEYLEGRGMQTVADIIPVYAPAFENDVDGYVNVVQRLVDTWRTNIQQGREPTSSQIQPWGNPLQAANTIMTQGYGLGTHAPRNIWGAIDLALDDDGDGEADPDGTQGQPVYATHAGMVTITPDSYPGGNHVWVENERYRTGYAHLTDFAVQDGQWVEPGNQIGTIGSTGLSSGPHLDYQVWSREGGEWINQNPLDFGALEQ